MTFSFFFFPSIPFIPLSLLFSNEGALNWKEWPPPKRHGVCLECHLFHNNTSFLSKALIRMKRDLLSIIPMLVKILLGIIPNTYPVLIYLETLHVKVLLRHPSAQSLRTLKITWYKDLESRTLYLSLLTSKRSYYVPQTKTHECQPQYIQCRVYSININKYNKTMFSEDIITGSQGYEIMQWNFSKGLQVFNLILRTWKKIWERENILEQVTKPKSK